MVCMIGFVQLWVSYIISVVIREGLVWKSTPSNLADTIGCLLLPTWDLGWSMSESREGLRPGRPLHTLEGIKQLAAAYHPLLYTPLFFPSKSHILPGLTFIGDHWISQTGVHRETSLSGRYHRGWFSVQPCLRVIRRETVNHAKERSE